MEKSKSNISGEKLPLKANTEPVENTLFPFDVTRTGNRKRYFPYRAYHPKKENSSNKRLWMELYPEPKRQTGQGTTEKQGTPRHDGEPPVRQKRYEYFTRDGKEWSKWFHYNGEEYKWQLKNKLRNEYRTAQFSADHQTGEIFPTPQEQ